MFLNIAFSTCYAYIDFQSLLWGVLAVVLPGLLVEELARVAAHLYTLRRSRFPPSSGPVVSAGAGATPEAPAPLGANLAAASLVDLTQRALPDLRLSIGVILLLPFFLDLPRGSSSAFLFPRTRSASVSSAAELSAHEAFPLPFFPLAPGG